jgi:putative flippase GtrA
MGIRQGALENVALKSDGSTVTGHVVLIALARKVLASPIVRFLVVGGANALLHAALSLLFMWLMPFSKQLSSTLAYPMGIPVAFLAYKKFVFRAGSAISHG